MNIGTFQDDFYFENKLYWCKDWGTTGCPKKTHFQNAAGATVHWLNHHLPAPLVPGLQTLEIDILVVSY